MSVFKDQEKFMVACDQTVDTYNEQQLNMYVNLIQEETNELAEALTNNDRVETLDALIDIIVVTIGAIHSMGANGDDAWNEVMRSNMSKIDKETGKVIKRADGKVLKPSTYSPPNLTPFVSKN